MPLVHELRDHVIWITTVGDVEYDEGLAALGRALADAERTDPKAQWDIAFDVRQSSENRSPTELEGIASFVAMNDAVLSRRCVVIAGDDFHYGLSRMFQAYCELRGIRSAAVRDTAAALEWLEESSA
jgi:hypothetical protein